MSIFKNIRFYILAASFLLSLFIYVWVIGTNISFTSQTAKLTRWYGLISVFFLYITLLIGPFFYTFTIFPKKLSKLFSKSRRALGVSVFYFALLHSVIPFFTQLGGFFGLAFLSNKYLISLSLGAIALLIFFFLTITSLDYAVTIMEFKNWKLLHRLIYLAGFLLLIHILMLGSDFITINTAIPQLSILLLLFLLYLEARRFDFFLREKFSTLPALGFTTSFVLFLVLFYFIFSLMPTSSLSSFNIHSAHVQLAKDIQNQTSNNPLNPKIPGMDGDRTKRYTAGITASENIQPNTDVTISFDVYDAANGTKVSWFKSLYTKPMHLVIVDDSLSYFNHIHPTQHGTQMQITTSFPHPGVYHLYIDFQPLGGIEQQIGFTLPVGNPQQIVTSNQKPNESFSKTIDNYTVKLTKDRYQADLLNQGQQLLTFKITDNNGNDVTTLKPYLASFGHLVMINQKTYDYLHVHPTNLVAPKPNDNGGPVVEFMPLGLYNTIKPGIYRVFAQFNPNNKLIMADYTIIVE